MMWLHEGPCEKTTAWWSKLSSELRALVEARLRELALDPESAPFREPGDLQVDQVFIGGNNAYPGMAAVVFSSLRVRGP